MNLAHAERVFIEAARTATLATIDPGGRPRLVPICFVLIEDVIWSPLDEKPKSVADPVELARVRDIADRPEVSLLVDRWSEDWTELGWVRLRGTATLVGAGDVPAEATSTLREKYPQYRTHDLEHRPAIRIAVVTSTTWRATPAQS